jgi:2-amino-4-hydroxy-6-hydroxymethyldihydropteridine diphosphokinase
LNTETVYLCLGSNLGNREEYLKMARDLIGERWKIDKASLVYETMPVGNTNQPRFLNQVIKINTSISPVGLLIVIKSMENKLGRLPDPRPNAPRIIDIDILLYGDKVINQEPQLTVPHARLHERAFVLVPFAEIAPDVVHPVLHKTIKELCDKVEGKEGVTIKKP